jgi:hypothetical protein
MMCCIGPVIRRGRFREKEEEKKNKDAQMGRIVAFCFMELEN